MGKQFYLGPLKSVPGGSTFHYFKLTQSDTKQAKKTLKKIWTDPKRAKTTYNELKLAKTSPKDP